MLRIDGGRRNFQHPEIPARVHRMRCRYCSGPAGWCRRSCGVCRSLNAVLSEHRGADLSLLMDLFIATGAPRVKIEAFLQAAPGGGATIRDQIAADMTNDLLSALGQRARQTAADVQRVRKRGNWVGLDQRPRE